MTRCQRYTWMAVAVGLSLSAIACGAPSKTSSPDAGGSPGDATDRPDADAGDDTSSGYDRSE